MPSHRKCISRRHFLRGSGIAISLPLLSAMKSRSASWLESEWEPISRSIFICGGLGFHKPLLFPETTGFDYDATPYTELLGEHRNELTLISGLSHPEQNGNNGHASSLTWLTAARRPGLSGFKNTVSIDQLMAHHVAGQTRFPYLCLANDGGSLSWTANGVNIPSEQSPSKLFQRMFVNGTESEQAQRMDELARGRSILDTVLDDANELERQLGQRDREKLDEYLSSIRELEQRIDQSVQWEQLPKPVVDYESPDDITDRNDIVARQRLMYDMMTLAIQTDSTRVITLSLGGSNSVPSNIPGVTTDWHNLSHHGKDEEKITELRRIEEAELIEFDRFLSKLKSVSEDGQTLLDQTAILFGSNLGNASSHDWRNLPIVVAGGGYRHGSYVAHDESNNTPLSNLFVSFAQRMGIELEQFGTSNGQNIHGLESA